MIFLMLCFFVDLFVSSVVCDLECDDNNTFIMGRLDKTTSHHHHHRFNTIIIVNKNNNHSLLLSKFLGLTLYIVENKSALTNI